jgi:hypothetical protein
MAIAKLAKIDKDRLCLKNENIWLNNNRLMVFNPTFNNISAISRWSVLLVEETGVPVEYHK